MKNSAMMQYTVASVELDYITTVKVNEFTMSLGTMKILLFTETMEMHVFAKNVVHLPHLLKQISFAPTWKYERNIFLALMLRTPV